MLDITQEGLKKSKYASLKEEIDPYHVNLPQKAPEYVQTESDRYMPVGYIPATRVQRPSIPTQDTTSMRTTAFPRRVQKVTFEDTTAQEPMMLDNFKVKTVKPEAYKYCIM